jgi:DNA-binding SARP family transcriptional activator/TolB-like protein
MIQLCTLGSLDLRAADGREVRSVLAQPKRLALLVYLAAGVPGGGFARRDTLLAMFWPESSDERGRGAFRQAVLYLRRSLGKGVLVNRAEDELGIAPGAIQCDATGFRAALAAGDDEAALSLYGGDLLDGFFVADAPGFEQWLEAERADLRAEAAAAAWRLAEAASAEGDDLAAVEWARRGVELAPLDEAAVRRRIALLARTGDRTGAVAAFDEFARRLADELELEPASATRALVDGIRGEVADREAPIVPAASVAAASAAASAASVAAAPPPAPSPILAGRPVPSASGHARRGHVGRLAVTGAVAVLALTGLAYVALSPSAEPTLEPRRVVVIPFENRTGDEGFDPVANMAADWIVQGLTGRGALQVVPVRAVLVSRRHLAGMPTADSAEPDPLPMGREVGAGTAVTGSYYRQGDSLHFQARVVDVATARVLAAVGPVRSGAHAPLDGVDALRTRILDALAPLSDERDTHVRLVRAPPPYDAYHAYVSGFESFVNNDVSEALRHFERAIAADSTFAMASVSAAIMHTNLGRWAPADSIADRLQGVRHELGPMELNTLDMLRGWLRGDNHAAYEATRRQALLAPGSIGEYQVAEQARRLNRPGESIRVLTDMGPERGELRGWFPYWRELTAAHHMLGNHRAELRVARRAREIYPSNPQILAQEVMALAALGRLAAVDRLIEERLAHATPESPSAGAIMVTAARELRAHGRPEAATAILLRSLDWYRALPEGGPMGDPRASIAIVLYELGHWAEARDAFAVLAAERPGSIWVRGRLGTLAARRGDRAGADAADDWLRDLDEPYLMGQHTLWRARIAAVSGDHERAVNLLRQAIAEGVQHGTHFHTDVDLAALRDRPDYRELLRPRG